ncbi:MAG: hypothetical protein ACR2LR_16810 [Hassallia sp.]
MKENIWLNQIFKVIVVGLAVLFVQCFGEINILPAQADSIKTPEAKYYNAEPTEKDKQLIDNTKNNLKDIGDNVREKLNLDEPLPQSTKDFLNSSEKKVDEVVNPITRGNKGYYQENK